MSETVPLTTEQKGKFGVCIQLLIRYTDKGVVPKYIYFLNKTRQNNVDKEYEQFCHRLDPAEAFYDKNKQSRYVFHTILNEKEIANSFIKICDDEFENKWEFIRLIPVETKCRADQELTFRIGKFEDIWFRQITRSHGDWKDYEYAIIHPENDDEVLPEDHDDFKSDNERIERIKAAFREEKNLEKLLRCKVVILPEETINMYSVKKLLKNGIPKSGVHLTASFSMDVIYDQLEFGHFRRCLQSVDAAEDLLPKALVDLRGQFEALLTSKYLCSLLAYQEMTRIFDLSILKMFKLKGNGGKQHVVFDDINGTLYFVEVMKSAETAGKVYDRCSSLETDCSTVQMAVREYWLRYQCLHGQDDEFNIFRSLCFAPRASVFEQYRIGFVALALQILLCLGITMDSWEKWSDTTVEDVWESLILLNYETDEILIVAISALTFGFISQRLGKTVASFERFYRNMREICFVPSFIIVLDFAANIIVGTWMAVLTPFFLLQSEDIQTVVLNSFALTIFVELDDLANIFESDEPWLLKEDANGMRIIEKMNKYELLLADRRKRQIEGIRKTIMEEHREDYRKKMMKEWPEADLKRLDKRLDMCIERMRATKRNGVPAKRLIESNLTARRCVQLVITCIFSPIYETLKIAKSMCRIFQMMECCCARPDDPELTGLADQTVLRNAAVKYEDDFEEDVYWEKLAQMR